MLVTGPDDSILLLVFIGFYPEAVLVFLADGSATRRGRGRAAAVAAAGTAVGVSSQTGAAGNSPTEARLSGNNERLQKQSSLDWMVHFISSSQTGHEEGGGGGGGFSCGTRPVTRHHGHK